MDVYIQSFNDFFTKTVWGVLFIGIAGSILGALLIAAIKYAFRYLRKNAFTHFLQAIYPIAREGLAANLLAEQLVANSNFLKLYGYLAYSAANFASISSALFVSVAVTVFTIINFGLERPLIQSACIAVTLYTFYIWLKSGVVLSYLIMGNFDDEIKKMKLQVPKSYNDWAKENPPGQKES